MVHKPIFFTIFVKNLRTMILDTIKKLMSENKMSTKEIARKIGTNRHTLGRNLNGTTEMKISTLEAIIDTIGRKEIYCRLMLTIEPHQIDAEIMDMAHGLVRKAFSIQGKPDLIRDAIKDAETNGPE